MDWSEILLILLFLLFPLLQQLLGKRSPPSLPPEAEVDEDEDEESVRHWRLPEATTVPAEGPAEGPDELLRNAREIASQEVVNQKQADELLVLQSRLPTASVPEVVRVSSPVVSLESLHVERPVSAARRTPQLSVTAKVAASRYVEPRAAMGLHNRQEVRRALLLAEILSKPRSLD